LADCAPQFIQAHAGVEPGADKERLSGLNLLNRWLPSPDGGHSAQVSPFRPDRQWRVTVRRSPRLLAVVGAGHGLAALAVLLALVNPALWLALLLVCAASLATSLRQLVILTAPDAIVELAVDDHAGAVVRRRDGRSQEGRVLPSSFVSVPLTIVRLRLAGEWLPRSIVLVRGNCDPDAWRRLRVALVWRIGPRLAPHVGRAD